MLRLPRSASFVVWGNAYLAGRVDAAAALAAVTGGDEPHTVRIAADLPPPGGGTDPGDPGELLTALRRTGTTRFRVVLPAPGDALGLPGPADFNRAAVPAGECVVTEGRPGALTWGLVPVVTRFGSPVEPGTRVTWVVHRVPTVPDPSDTLAEADRELREATLEAGEALAGLDLVDLDGEATAALARLRRDGELPPHALPPDSGPRSVGVLTSAARMRLLVATAEQGGGQPLDGQGVGRRAQVLGRLDTVARRALAAAVNAAVPLPGPGRG